MKKIVLSLLLVISILVLTSCSLLNQKNKINKRGNTVSCLKNDRALGIDYKIEVIGGLADDKIESASVKISCDTEEKAKSLWYAFENQNLHLDKKTMTASNYEDLEDDKVIGLTKSEFMNKFTKDGYACE